MEWFNGANGSYIRTFGLERGWNVEETYDEYLQDNIEELGPRPIEYFYFVGLCECVSTASEVTQSDGTILFDVEHPSRVLVEFPLLWAEESG